MKCPCNFKCEEDCECLEECECSELHDPAIDLCGSWWIRNEEPGE